MTAVEPIVASADIAHAWAQAFSLLENRHGHEASPLVVSIDVDGRVQEDSAVRRLVDQELAQHSLPSVQTVASTIFPASLWRRDEPATSLFARYDRLWPRIKKAAANRNGTYFRRFSAFPGVQSDINQLEHVISTWQRGNHRRSALQLAVFDPTRDHTHQRQRGFPCLQQVSVVPDGNQLDLCAFYAMQLVLEKAYGNYLGLVRLGEFLAHEMTLELRRVTCVASVTKLSQAPGFTKKRREALAKSIREAVGSATA